MTAQDAPLVLTADNRAEIARHLPRLVRPALGIVTQLKVGSLTVELPDGRALLVKSPEAGPAGAIALHRWRALRRAALRGDVGLGEAYMDGDWDSPDLATFLEVFSSNAVIAAGRFAARSLSGLMLRIGHALRRNSLSGSRRNIAAHYDLGNDFYAEWLDPSMTYSSALFSGGAKDLETAQAQKYRALIARTGITQDHHVLEIGCGWGGFASLAAKETGCRVTALTLSPAQKKLAETRVAAAGLSDRINVELCDYRHVEGTFDRIISIEMFEAVGEAYWPVYFSAINDRLKPGGMAGLQVITIRDEAFPGYRKGADFLQTYIFPGGLLPPSGGLPKLATAAGLVPSEPMRFGTDYAKTLGLWLKRFDGAWPTIAPQGFDERFRRMWRFYLAICEAGFRSGLIDVEQIALSKP